MMKLSPAMAIQWIATLLTLIPGCSSDHIHDVPSTNQAASAVRELPLNSLQWKVITIQIDRRRGRMSTLYGNDIALAHAMSPNETNPPQNSNYALVSWRQTVDPNWIGAKIPDQVECVEIVKCEPQIGNEAELTYQRFAGAPLRLASGISTNTADQRKRYIISLKAAVMP